MARPACRHLQTRMGRIPSPGLPASLNSAGPSIPSDPAGPCSPVRHTQTRLGRITSTLLGRISGTRVGRLHNPGWAGSTGRDRSIALHAGVDRCSSTESAPGPGSIASSPGWCRSMLFCRVGASPASLAPSCDRIKTWPDRFLRSGAISQHPVRSTRIAGSDTGVYDRVSSASDRIVYQKSDQTLPVVWAVT